MVCCDPVIDPLQLGQPLQQIAPGQPLWAPVLRWRRRKAAVQRMVARKRHLYKQTKKDCEKEKKGKKCNGVLSWRMPPLLSQTSWKTHSATMEQSVKYSSQQAPPTAFLNQWGSSSRSQRSTLPGNIFGAFDESKASPPFPCRRSTPNQSWIHAYHQVYVLLKLLHCRVLNTKKRQPNQRASP